jgi:threonine aldolase
MVFGDCQPPLTAAAFMERCREAGVLLDQASLYRWRMVTHRGVTADDVDNAIGAVRRLFAAPLRATG